MDAQQLLDDVREQVPGDNAAGSTQDARWAILARKLARHQLPYEQHWEAYQANFAGRRPEDGPPIAWAPGEKEWRSSNMGAVARKFKRADYRQLRKFGRNPDSYWGFMLERLNIPFKTEPRAVLDEPVDPKDPVWFPEAELNIAEACFQAPLDQVAIIETTEGAAEPRNVTYRDLRILASRFANGLMAAGYGPGDGVALYMPMNVECVAAYLGTVMAGCHVVSIPDSFAAPEISTRLRLGTAKAAVTMHSFQRGGKAVPLLPKLKDAADGMDVRCIVLGEGDSADGDVAWTDFLAKESVVQLHYGAPDRVANVLFSSGTTGEPKAIPWTHLTPIKAAADGHMHQDIQPDDVVAWPTNIGWMMGPWLIFATFINRATMHLHQGVPMGEEYIRSLAESKVTVLGVVPAIVRAWLADGIAPGALPDVRIFSSTGEASNPHDYLYLMSLANHEAPIIEYCGGTEIGGGHITGSILQPASPATFTTAAMGLDFVILNDDGTPTAPGGMGEIFLVPPSVGMSQTLLNKDHHAEYYTDVPAGPDGQQLRRHGDQIEVLHNGFYAPQGRADDTMNLGGIKVGSIELETAMNSHEAVAETAAVAVPPEGGGADRLIVFAVSEATADALKPDLQALIKQHLNPLFRIHDVVVVDKLPRTASNKVMRKDLRKQYVKG